MRSHTLPSLLASLLLLACGGTTTTPEHPPTEPPSRPPTESSITYLDQGWSAERREEFYTTPQGSQLIPYDWYLALEQPDSETPLRDDAYLASLGFLPAEGGPSEHNPDALPVGFTRELDGDGRAWFGFTCAACHTNEITYQGATFRVDGAPALIRLSRFQTDMKTAMERTAEDDARFARFADRVLGEVPEAQTPAGRAERATALRAELRQRIARLPQIPPDAGYGRQDAFGVILNEVTGTELGIPENFRDSNAPVSFPHLWLTTKLAWVQWNGLAESPISRNVGEVLGVFGHIDWAGLRDPQAGVASTVRLENLHHLEQWVDELRPPRWPEALGAIDTELAARGRAIYEGEGRCSSCHSLRPYEMTEANQFGRQFIRIHMTPLEEIGTDPLAVMNSLTRTAQTGPLAPIFGGQSEVPALEILILATKLIFARESAALGLTEEQTLAYVGFRYPPQDPPNLRAYKAGPLDGIWASAPYLHNGSVPSLYQLLLPPAERVATFHVGAREYDPVNVGFVTGAGENRSVVDTSTEGSRNTGHTYGTDLTEADRRALLEFLKTL